MTGQPQQGHPMSEWACKQCDDTECKYLINADLHNFYPDVCPLNPRCMNPPTNWIRSHPHQSERDTVLDDLCNIDLTYYIWGEKQSDEVGLCRGRTCNYCGRYNVELLQQAGEPCH